MRDPWFRGLFAATVVAGLAAALTCPSECDRSRCDDDDDNECRGGRILDACGCCEQCAKVMFETCGGLHGLAGQCDRGLVCVTTPPRRGQPITGHESGICLQRRESCASPRNHSGCNLVEGSCLCSVVTSCDEPRFDFERVDDCYKASVLKPVYLLKVGSSSPDCANVPCDKLHVVCNADSMAVADEPSPGQCCPTHESLTCRCNTDLCHMPECIADFQRLTVKKATGIPGECCDVYECVYLGKNCSAVQCPESKVLCPTDSYALPGIRAEDECCSRPQGCACLPVDCPEPECPQGQKLKVLQPRTGTPGSCCDQFHCLRDNESTCVYEGHEYVDGAVWKADNCTSCACKGGLTQCSSVLCQVAPNCGRMEVPSGDCCPVCTGCVSRSGVIHKFGESWMEDDCTSCSCDRGKVECQAEMCHVPCTNPRVVPGQCCPQCDEPNSTTVSSTSCPTSSCSLTCLHGLEKDSNGCDTCRCKMENCDIHCESGFEIDDIGTLICKCRCPSLDSSCDKKCLHGFRHDARGCLTCRCARCRSLKCAKKCPFGHVRNDRGCRTCKCLDGPELELTTTEIYNATASIVEVDSGLVSVVVCHLSDGTIRDEGEMWHDGCRNCYCHAGNEMCALITCPVPTCHEPVTPPGECCPKCSDDAAGQPLHNVNVCQAVDGRHFVEGENFELDRCTLCVCHIGQVLCVSEACPPAACEEPLHDSDSCCPMCPGTVKSVDVVEPRRHCKLETGQVHVDGSSWRVDACRSCTCTNGTVVCFSVVCPKVNCTKPILKKHQCCPFCLGNSPATCIHDELVYVSGAMWSINACTQCVCVKGQTVCKEQICSVGCPDPVVHSDRCCPECSDMNTSSISQPAATSTVPFKKDIHNANESQLITTLLHVILPVSLVLILAAAAVTIVVVCVRQRHRFYFESQKLQNNSVSDISHPTEGSVMLRSVDNGKKTNNYNLLPYVANDLQAAETNSSMANNLLV